jgi:hypothetical protein
VVVRTSFLSTLKPVPTNQATLKLIRAGLESTNQRFQLSAKAALVRLSNEFISVDRYLVQGSGQWSESPPNDKSFSIDAVRNLQCSVDMVTNGPGTCGTAVAFTLANLSRDKAFSFKMRHSEPEIFRISIHRPLTEFDRTNTLSGGLGASVERTRISKPRPSYRHGEETFRWDLPFTIAPRRSKTWVVPLADIIDPKLGRHGEQLTNCTVFATAVLPVPPRERAPFTIFKENVCVALP